MYGKRRYQPISKPIEVVPQVDNSVPNFLCPHCKHIKTINTPHIEITALENGQLFMYTKLCSSCATLLNTWMKG